MGRPISPSLCDLRLCFKLQQQFIVNFQTNFSLNSPCSYTLFTTDLYTSADLCIEISVVHSAIGLFVHKISSLAECTWKTKLSDLSFEPLYCQISYHAPRPTKNFATLDRWHTRPANNINGFLKYQRSHTIIFFIILMNEKSVSISVYLENKATIIRLSPCVHITFWTVTFRFLWMLTSYVTGGCCHISVVSECYGSPLKTFVLHYIYNIRFWCQKLTSHISQYINRNKKQQHQMLLSSDITSFQDIQLANRLTNLHPRESVCVLFIIKKKNLSYFHHKKKCKLLIQNSLYTSPTHNCKLNSFMSMEFYRVTTVSPYSRIKSPRIPINLGLSYDTEIVHRRREKHAMTAGDHIINSRCKHCQMVHLYIPLTLFACDEQISNKFIINQLSSG